MPTNLWNEAIEHVLLRLEDTARRAHGPVVQRRPYSYDPTFSRAQAVLLDADGGWRVGSDPRTGSGGVAYA